MILNLKLTQLILTYALLLVANYVLFGFTLLWVTGAFLALFVAPVVYQMYAEMMKQSPVDKFPNDVIPPFALPTATGIVPTGLPDSGTQIPAESHESLCPVMTTPQLSSAYKMWSLFGTMGEVFKSPNLPSVIPFSFL